MKNVSITHEPLDFVIETIDKLINLNLIIENYCEITYRQIVTSIKDVVKEKDYNFNICWLNLNIFIEDVYRMKGWSVSYHPGNPRSTSEAYFIFKK
jgi:hypothetical protein